MIDWRKTYVYYKTSFLIWKLTSSTISATTRSKSSSLTPFKTANISRCSLTWIERTQQRSTVVFQTITISIFSIKNISRHQQKKNFIQSEWKVGKKKKRWRCILGDYISKEQRKWKWESRWNLNLLQKDYI